MCPSSVVMPVAQSRLFYGILLFIPWGFYHGISGLRLKNMHVPTSVMSGSSVWLNCTLDDEGRKIYSIKWYKTGEEFYRYLPVDNPKSQTYDLPGVSIDLTKSTRGNVFLKNINLQTEGLYRCEASEESPSFQTVEAEKQMNVYVLPQNNPIIYGNLHKYELNDFVNVTCRSGPSKPPAKLMWFINGKQAPPEFITASKVIDHINVPQISTSTLAFVVTPEHLGKDGAGAITFKCESIVYQNYSMSSEELVVENKNPETSPRSGTSPPHINQLQEGPVLEGLNGHTDINGRYNYRVGDQISINCSSTTYNIVPVLQWYINDEEVDLFDVKEYRVITLPDGQKKFTLGLNFTLTSRHFGDQNEMRLKCMATLSEIINTRSEEKTVGGNHRSSGLHVLEDTGKVSDRSTGINSYRSSFFVHLLFISTLWKAL